MSDSFLFHTKVKESGKKSKLVQEFLEKEKLKPPTLPKRDFDIHEFISSQEIPDSSVEKLESQSRYLKEIRLSVIPEQFYKIENTLKLFEQNIDYFVQHRLEFSRLVAQLVTNERQIFLHSVYTYYYADVLLSMKKLKHDSNPDLASFCDDDKAVDDVFREYIRHDEDEGKIHFDTNKVIQIHQCILNNLTELKTSQTNAFYNLLLKLNSREIYILQELLSLNRQSK